MIRTKSRSGFTLTEVLMALGLSMFIAAIGFTGVQTFGKAVSRAKQFYSETQVITASLIMAGTIADDTTATNFSFGSISPAMLSCPPSWPQPSVTTSGISPYNLPALLLRIDTSKKDYIGRMGGDPNRPEYDVLVLEVTGRLKP